MIYDTLCNSMLSKGLFALLGCPRINILNEVHNLLQNGIHENRKYQTKQNIYILVLL